MFPRVIVTLSTFAPLSVNSAKGLAVRFFAKSTLSDEPRFFATLRMTGSEGLRMTLV